MTNSRQKRLAPRDRVSSLSWLRVLLLFHIERVVNRSSYSTASLGS